MNRRERRVARGIPLGFAIVLACVSASAVLPPVRAQAPARGQNVVPVYEGFWTNADGTFDFLFGYYNRPSMSANPRFDRTADFSQTGDARFISTTGGANSIFTPQDRSGLVSQYGQRPVWISEESGVIG